MTPSSGTGSQAVRGPAVVDGESFDVERGETSASSARTARARPPGGMHGGPAAARVARSGSSGWIRRPTVTDSTSGSACSSRRPSCRTGRVGEALELSGAIPGPGRPARSWTAGAWRRAKPGRQVVRRREAATVHRARPGREPGGGHPRRAHRGPGSRCKARDLGPDRQVPRQRRHCRAGQPLHGRGGGTVRSPRDPRTGPDRGAPYPGGAGGCCWGRGTGCGSG